MGGEVIKKSCCKNEVPKDGAKWITDPICKVCSTTAPAEFKGKNAYHIDINLYINST